MIKAFPHCDSRVLHAPGECEFCDNHPEWQELRQSWGIAFTGHPPRSGLPECRKIIRELGYSARCKQRQGHEGECKPFSARDILPCPADFTRPPGSRADHRRWGGNTATTKRGDSSQPRQTLASIMMYGDQGGREQWPLFERSWIKVVQPWKHLGMRLRGWYKDGPFWIRSK